MMMNRIAASGDFVHQGARRRFLRWLVQVLQSRDETGKNKRRW
jgi:hypothetical protein